jgi:hypothetical protein
MFGLIPYLALSICKIIITSHMTEAESSVLAARLAHDAYFAKVVPVDEEESEHVLLAF